MNILITIIIVGFVLFILGGFAAFMLDQRAETRHWEEMYDGEHRSRENLQEKVVELKQELQKSKSDKVGV